MSTPASVSEKEEGGGKETRGGNEEMRASRIRGVAITRAATGC